MELTLKPTWKQHLAYKALDTPGVDEVFFGGGAGGGKSWALCESRLVRAIRYPGYKSFIGRNELKRLMQSTFITWVKVCKFHKLEQGSHWRLNGQYNFIELWNGSRIDLLDLKFLPSEDPLYERFGSLEYSDGAIEEAGEVHPLAHEVVKTRRNRHLNKELGIPHSMLCTGNPKKNWTYQQFYKPWKKQQLPEDIVFIQSLYKDNPHTAAEYGATLSKLKDRVMLARLRDGIWEYESDPGTLIDFEAIDDMFTNAVDEDEEKYATIDVARYGDDKTVLTLWQGWKAYKILSWGKQGIDQTSDKVKQVLRDERIPYSHVIADEDGVGGGLVDNLRGIRGFIANASPVQEQFEQRRSNDAPDVTRSFSNLKTQCAYALAEQINTRKVAVETDDANVKAWLTEDLEQIKEANVDADDKKRSLVPKIEVKEVLGRSPDFGDTFVMRAYFLLQRPKSSSGMKVHRPNWKSYGRRG